MNQENFNDWIATDTTYLPDFIIGGAMKSGTSTLHQILNKHPKVFIPTNEIGFFDIDNILQHSDFCFYNKKNHKWTTQFMQDNPQKLWDWYFEKFKGKKDLIKGEDSTTYLASKIAAERIAIQNKEIKLIFLLRHPTKRTYSNYYHLLSSGRSVYDFEDTLRYEPTSILTRSLYKEHLKNYYDLIPSTRIKVILFEDLIHDTKNTIKDICEFIHVDFTGFQDSDFNIHANKAKYPRNYKLQLIKNRLLRGGGYYQYSNMLPFTASHNYKINMLIHKVLNKVHSMINPMVLKQPPEIKNATKEYLDKYFINSLNGIDNLVSDKIMMKWFPENFDKNV